MKRIKTVRIILLIILLLITFSFLSDAKDKPLFGVSLVAKDNQWWATAGLFVGQTAEIFDVDIVVLWANASQEKQIKDIEDLVQMQVDIILMGPVEPEGSIVAVETAYKAKIPLVTIARKSASNKVTAEVTYDDYILGVNQCKYVVKDFPNGANIVYLFGPVAAGFAKEQYAGFIDELSNHPKHKLLETYRSPTDTIADGLKQAEDALVRFDKIDVFCATNDDQALGGVQAAKAANRLDKIKVYGNSGVPMGLLAVYNGELAYASIKSQADMIYKCFETGLKIIEGEEFQKSVALASKIITKDNILTIKDPSFGGTIANPETWKPPSK